MNKTPEDSAFARRVFRIIALCIIAIILLVLILVGFVDWILFAAMRILSIVLCVMYDNHQPNYGGGDSETRSPNPYVNWIIKH